MKFGALSLAVHFSGLGEDDLSSRAAPCDGVRGGQRRSRRLHLEGGRGTGEEFSPGEAVKYSRTQTDQRFQDWVDHKNSPEYRRCEPHARAEENYKGWRDAARGKREGER